MDKYIYDNEGNQPFTLDGGEKAPLGIKAKSSTPPLQDADKRRSIRRERYQLGRTARAIYAKAGERAGLEYVLNYHRTARCAYVAHSDVTIQKSVEYKSAFFTGVTVCGNVWTCPNCAVKVQERRRLEIAKAMDHFYDKGNMKAVMITFTFPHAFGDDLEAMLERQAGAFKRLRAGNPWTKFKNRNGYKGLIRSLEVTFGDNGYHPHTHELWFVDKYADAEKIKADVLKRWETSCIREGLLSTDEKSINNFREHAIDVKDNVSTSDYLAKQDDSRHWGADREIAKATSKAGRKSGVHPFMFLERFKETGEGVWSGRWLEYTKAFKGKRQLFWSHGLKKEVGIDEITDQELAIISEDDAKEVIELTKGEWRKTRNNPSIVLDTAEETTKKEVIRSVINSIPDDTDYRLIKTKHTAKVFPLSGQMIDEVLGIPTS